MLEQKYLFVWKNRQNLHDIISLVFQISSNEKMASRKNYFKNLISHLKAVSESIFLDLT